MAYDGATMFAYWGKAMPGPGAHGANYHLLVYHALDVAAVGRYLAEAGFSLQPFAAALGWPLEQVVQVHLFFLALHDPGKFARAFQGLAPDLSPELVRPVPFKRYKERHDTLGWLLWRDYLGQDFPGQVLPDPENEFWQDWCRAVTGHHGQPPKEAGRNGWTALYADDYFCPDDVEAAREFYREVAGLLLPEAAALPVPGERERVVLKQHSWHLAGMAVLADWLGSDQGRFAYRDNPQPLPAYWRETALPAAGQAVRDAGVKAEPVRQHASPLDLFDYLRTPTPLQRLVAGIELDDGPQLFMLEDVTGAGKTEAALILAYRLMAQGHAQGLYFGLPTMATANQMYRRVGHVYRKFYEEGTEPSLVLAHGARKLVGEFRDSLLAAPRAGDADYQEDEASASSQCAAWLADGRKKALLAQIGVGTLDQALLAVLPVRHQSLRLLGLSQKVLLVDEVHAYDPYMRELLATLLTAHARQGGSAILLSATLPADLRDRLARAFAQGAGRAVQALDAEPAYPLMTQVGTAVSTHACGTRRELVRSVRVHWLHDEDAIVALIEREAAAGRSVCWIRNTVGDARTAHDRLRVSIAASRLTLFHSRYAMADRLDIEDTVLARFGKASTTEDRAGQVLVATQVVEQSLDLDFDVLVTDLAPMELLIQRAGRLHRHVRDAAGSPADTEGRPAPVLHVFAPEFTDDPKPDWYQATFRKACYVYPDVGRLWLAQRVLERVGQIVSPGEPHEPGGVRGLVEAVYGREAEAIPDALLKATDRYMGAVMAEISQARFNVLDLEVGYCQRSSQQHWHEDTRVPTRLSEESRRIYLARDTGGALEAWRPEGDFPWEQSAVSVDARYITALSPAWQRRFGQQIDVLRARYRLLSEPALIVPLVVGDDGGGSAEIVGLDSRQASLVYNAVAGLRFEREV